MKRYLVFNNYFQVFLSDKIGTYKIKKISKTGTF